MELTSHHKAKYGAWAGRQGRPADPCRCAEEVSDRGTRWPTYHQCRNKRGHGPEGAYCKQHDPEAKARRQAEADARASARLEQRKAEVNGPGAIKMLRAIAAGHNDPRGAAIEWLAAHGFKED